MLQIRMNKNNFINDLRRKVSLLGGPIKLLAVEKALSAGVPVAGIASTYCVPMHAVNLG
jgi:hypothetical protein